ncbi:receptor-type tyrosine-protein phosphatase S [Salvelinus alpinus]
MQNKPFWRRNIILNCPSYAPHKETRRGSLKKLKKTSHATQCCVLEHLKRDRFKTKPGANQVRVKTGGGREVRDRVKTETRKIDILFEDHSLLFVGPRHSSQVKGRPRSKMAAGVPPCLCLPALLPLSTLLLCMLLTGFHALSQPRFTKVPVDQIGVSGGVVSFVCQATGDPKPRVSWNKKGKKVNSQRIETIEFDEGAGAVLRIQPLRAPRDENIYECVAENSEGEVNVNAKLSIIREDLLPGGFPNIDMGPQLKVVERTRTATMLCAASGNPDPEITWFKDFLPIDPNASNGRIKQLRSGKEIGTPIRGALQIENSEETDQGKYECVASNVEGVRYSSPANLYVRVRRVPPRFSIPPTSHEMMPGGSVNITCVAVGSPMPYVKWMLNSEDLTPEDEMPVGRNVLELNSVRESANYTCVAMSSLGIIEAVAQITVKSLPKPPGTPMVTETTATSVTITWDSGNPDPVSYYIIQYRAKSPDSKFETMDGITTTRYSIGGLYPNTEYEIRVSAFNTIGQGPPSEPVETRTGEQAPASPPRNIQARIISQNTMMVRWDEPEEPNGQIKGYRVYYTMDPSQPMSLWQIHNVQDSIITTIQSLVASETYTIRVLAFTSVGDGPFSDPIHVKVLQGVPGQPTKFQVGAVSDTSMELTWEPAFQKEGIISFELRYKEGSFGSQVTKTFSPTASYVVEGLRANTEYYFSLAAISNKGIGAFTNEISQKTLQAKPSAPPQDVKCSSSSSTSLLVSWRPPPVESQNGALAGYLVRYQVVGASVEGGSAGEPMEEPAVLPNDEKVLLQKLEKWTQYSVTLAAFTEIGPGPESEPLLCRTDEDVPGAPPRRVEVEVLNSTALKVMWRSLLPGRQHGQIRGYQVHYVRVENGESRGLPLIKDVMLADAQRLANSKAHTSRFISANLPCNKFKNRLVNIMPYETTRVCLQPIRGLEGSDYINASFIDGYRQQKAYIATQGPLAETTEDFWRMMWENNSTIVVMLTKLREMGREKCHQYWPAERSARYQYFVVDPMAEYNMPQYILREFKVTDARDGQSRTVRQFQFTDWPEQGVPKSGEGFIDFIGQVHKTKEQFGQDGPISVHCSAGVGRTGVFTTLSIVLERMRYEGVVDIFQTVKMLRTQRPAMVQTEDEYQFCYQAGLEYLGSFDHYAT